MDDLTYVYKSGTNQLLRVEDASGNVPGADDIGDQDGDNYSYNAIGQLTNNAEEIFFIFIMFKVWLPRCRKIIKH